MHTWNFLVWEYLPGSEISVALIAVVMQYITVIIAEKFLPRHSEGQCLTLIYLIYTFLGHFYLACKYNQNLC